MNIGKLQRKERGFTLIEIAIVLVIIGLLLGGVLQGQQLIENSRVKSATNDFNGIAAGAFSYQDRYGRLPGDDPGALNTRGASWPATSAMAAGDADGVLNAPATDAFKATDEVGFFFSNLRSAGFISGDPASTGVKALPANPFGGLITMVTDQILKDASGNFQNGTKICMGNVSGTAAIALDTQLDDGNSSTGRFRASDSSTAPNKDPSDTADTAYSEDKSYTVCYRI